MRTPWVEVRKRERSEDRNEAFWRGELEEYPLLWVMVENAIAGTPPPAPGTEEELWTNVDYVVDAAEDMLGRTYYAGDALPVYNPWLGPDQFAAWLGAEMTLAPREFTSWVKPFVENWSAHPELRIDPENRWWQLYLAILKQCVERGKDKWVNCYPDLHTGIDALSAIRGAERLSMDLLLEPDAVKRAMDQMTRLFKQVVDTVSDILLPAGQGTSNWTTGWSAKRFVCIGQNDFTCMIGPEMFREFCQRDNAETCDYVDVSLFHMDGPGVANHLDSILEIERLNCIQWIQGAGERLPSQWLDLLKRIQAGGKSVQVFYGGAHGGNADVLKEVSILCENLDPTRLFVWAMAPSAEAAEALVSHTKKLCAGKRPAPIAPRPKGAAFGNKARAGGE